MKQILKKNSPRCTLPSFRDSQTTFLAFPKNILHKNSSVRRFAGTQKSDTLRCVRFAGTGKILLGSASARVYRRRCVACDSANGARSPAPHRKEKNLRCGRMGSLPCSLCTPHGPALPFQWPTEEATLLQTIGKNCSGKLSIFRKVQLFRRVARLWPTVRRSKI